MIHETYAGILGHLCITESGGLLVAPMHPANAESRSLIKPTTKDFGELFALNHVNLINLDRHKQRARQTESKTS